LRGRGYTVRWSKSLVVRIRQMIPVKFLGCVEIQELAWTFCLIFSTKL
jgi:hypothetical protein